MILGGKIAFITGSTRGIGWATAETFARNGATVVLSGRASQEDLDRLAEDLAARYDVDAIGLHCDVSEVAEIESAYQAIFKRFGRLDVLVNNAGVLHDGLLGMITQDEIDRVFAVNVEGTIHNLQRAARLMSRAAGGSIVNISSIVGTHGNAGQAVYASSKAAVVGLTLSAAKELAPRGVRVNAVAPGYIETDMIRRVPAQLHQRRLASIGMGRIGTPQDVADVILFFASDLSTYVTGQVLHVDGGMIL